MTAAASPMEVKKNGLRQAQDGHWTLSLVVHPNDMPDWLLTAPMGQRLALVVAALKDEAEKKPEPKERKRFDEMPLSQQAGILCGEIAFHRFLWETHKTEWESQCLVMGKDAEDAGEVATHVVYRLCAIGSRKQLDGTNSPGSVAVWRKLEGDYRAWLRGLSETGRVTEMR